MPRELIDPRPVIPTAYRTSERVASFLRYRDPNDVEPMIRANSRRAAERELAEDDAL